MERSIGQLQLRLFYLEDNPLLVFHLECILEEMGHTLVGSAVSFRDLKNEFSDLKVDAVLIDIDLADGRTGPAAAIWLGERNIPSIFVTGQQAAADDNRNVVLGIVSKPVSKRELEEALWHVHKPRSS